MLQKIHSNVYAWFEIHGESRNQPYPWNSYLIHIQEEKVLALVDPLPLSADEVQEVEELGRPTHILLTCNYHLRESEAYSKKWGCKILLPQEGLKDVEVPIDDTFRHGDLLWKSIEAIHLSDISWLEEMGFWVKRGRKALIIGDALCGGRSDIGISNGEIGIHPNRFDMRHITDIQKARKTLCKLMEYPFEAMFFGHGSPVIHSPKDAINR